MKLNLKKISHSSANLSTHTFIVRPMHLILLSPENNYFLCKQKLRKEDIVGQSLILFAGDWQLYFVLRPRTCLFSHLLSSISSKKDDASRRYACHLEVTKDHHISYLKINLRHYWFTKLKTLYLSRHQAVDRAKAKWFDFSQQWWWSVFFHGRLPKIMNGEQCVFLELYLDKHRP